MKPLHLADVAVVATSLQFPEGTIFVGNKLYFVDYATSDVLRLVGDTVTLVWHRDGCGANGLAAVADGLLVACFDSGIVAKISLDGRLLETISRDDAGNRLIAPNDLAPDRNGGVYFTSSGSGASVPGKVFHIGADGHVTQVADSIEFANGVAVAPDGNRLYVAETAAHRLLTFVIAGDGGLTERREFVQLGAILADGAHRVYSPDGVRIDKHGNLFVALYNGGGIAVIDPNGILREQVSLPASHHTNLALTPDGRFIYVTAVDDKPAGSYRGELLRIANPIKQ